MCVFQVWQWIRHQTQLEDDSRVVNRRLVTDLTADVMMELCTVCGSVRWADLLCLWWITGCTGIQPLLLPQQICSVNDTPYIKSHICLCVFVCLLQGQTEVAHSSRHFPGGSPEERFPRVHHHLLESGPHLSQLAKLWTGGGSRCATIQTVKAELPIGLSTSNTLWGHHIWLLGIDRTVKALSGTSLMEQVWMSYFK